MLASLISPLLNLGLGLGQGAYALSQNKVYDTPDIAQSNKDALALTKSMAGQDLAGFENMKANNDNTAAQTMQNISEMGGNGGALAGLQANTLKANNNLGIQNAQYHQGNQMNLIKGLNDMGKLEAMKAADERQQQMNYDSRKANAINTMLGNVSQSGQDLTQGYMNGEAFGMQQNLLQSMIDKNKASLGGDDNGIRGLVEKATGSGMLGAGMLGSGLLGGGANDLLSSTPNNFGGYTEEQKVQLGKLLGTKMNGDGFSLHGMGQLGNANGNGISQFLQMLLK